MNIKELLIKQAQAFSQKPAVIFGETAYTFQKLKDDSFCLANYLCSLGIKNNDKAAVFMPNTYQAAVSYLGILSAGAVLIPLDFMLVEEEIIHFVNHSESKVLIIQQKKDINPETIKQKCPGLKEIIVCKEERMPFASWEKLIAGGSPHEPVNTINQDDLSSIFYTSGSTGHPKGVMLTYKHFDNPVYCVDYFLHLSADDRILCGGLPFSHVGGFDYMLLMLAFGQTMILMERFHPIEFLKNAQAHKPTLVWMVPPMYVAILSLKDYAKFDLSSLRYVVVFGAPSSPVLLNKFHELCPRAHLINGWGMTETVAPNCFLPPDMTRIESVGKFIPGMEARIVDDNGDVLGEGERGELWVKGSAVMKGYYKEKELTDEMITPDGWLKTGDIAFYDTDRLFYIVGRKKDMIKVGGEVVFSSEVEEKIHRHPSIQEVAVLGVEDKLRGEIPKAFIVLKEKTTLDVQELKIFLKEHLAHFKIPHQYEFLAALPKTRSGKIDKQALKGERSPNAGVTSGRNE